MVNYLVTGANRGIGLEFIRQILHRGERVVACCRNPERAIELNRLASVHDNDRLVICKLDVMQATAITSLPELLKKKGILIDVLIPNAGVAAASERLGLIQEETMLRVLHTNAISPMLLTQAFADHLQAPKRNAKIVCISSDLGSITCASDLTFGLSYAMSKAALNMGVKKLSSDLANRGIVLVAIHPGWVQTDMGGRYAHLTPTESTQAMLGVIDKLSIAQSGLFLDYRGQQVPW